MSWQKPSENPVKFEYVVCRGSHGDLSRRVAFILPIKGFIDHVQECPTEYEYHFLMSDFDKNDALGFKADAYTEVCIDYCRHHRIEGAFGFDCFPSFIASIVSTELSLPGPSSLSIALCTNKYYLRKFVTPDVPSIAIRPLFDEIPEPTSYPCMLKGADSQYYIETRLVRNRSEWKSHIKQILKDPKKIEDRKRFYHKYVPGLADRWQDVVVFHVEPVFKGPEHQIELFMDDTSNVLCDTGDIIKKDGIITGFATPGSFDFDSNVKSFLSNVTGKLREFGCKNQALDVEFIQSSTGMKLIEINSRYSFMAWKSLDGNKIRNFENLTRASLGLPLSFIPLRDSPNHSVLGWYIYTNVLGKIDDQINYDQIQEWNDARQIEIHWKKICEKGCVEEDDCSFNMKYAKLAYISISRNKSEWQTSNEEIAYITRKIFNSSVDVDVDPVIFECTEPHTIPYDCLNQNSRPKLRVNVTPLDRKLKAKL